MEKIINEHKVLGQIKLRDSNVFLLRKKGDLWSALFESWRLTDTGVL